MHGKASQISGNTGVKCADGSTKGAEENCRGTAGRRLTGEAADARPVLGPHGKPLPRFVPTGLAGVEGFPNVQAFSEGNGNEHRASYKGYPKGYAQLLASPTTWINSPMIINTMKRLTGDTSPGPIARDPNLYPRANLAPFKTADYSGILERVNILRSTAMLL